MTWAVPIIVGGCFLVGHALHEATHAIAAIAVGGKIEDIGWQSVAFRTRGSRADNVVHAAPILAWVPLTAAVAYLTRPSGWGWLYVAALLAGYLPRSESDWMGLRGLVG